ncbi:MULTISPECIES: lanthionine synthetase LanC family protein [Streptomyces]|uniref:Subtilin biosynthesis protein spaC n=1 Tax=Streptomyces bangladeshensis TaxID=295352 RepID=A0ABP5NEU8_9ACTN|nr:lanthionine synthetase LanC family protein [Streptomyces sp. FBKL.4005]OYP10453.1 subtilin biosynthesis protein spaC [Streptomyces sp. FBKL.4005]
MTHHATTPATPLEDTHDFAVHYLRQWVTAPHDSGHPCDPGIPLLAHLVTDTQTAINAITTWARTAGRGPSHPALYDGGLAGTLIGLHLGARLHPVLHPAANRLAAHLRQHPPRYRTHTVTFPDYDLISGPAGTLLALCATDPTETADPNGTAQGADAVGAFETAGAAQPPPRALAAHLALLCDDEELPRLRTGHYAGHPHLAWVNGRINTGMGHGVAGVVTALTTALRHTHPDQDPDLVDSLTAALGRATRWLIRQAYDDERGIRTWPAAGLDHPPNPKAHPRQAWCYGTPGIAWALWDAADALGDTATADWAAAAFTTLAEHYDETFHLYGDTPQDRLGLCHGAAGVLAVTDAFDHHAELPAATPLKHRLVHHLTHHLASHPLSAWPTDLLNGLPGTLAALLTATRKTPRAWLACLGLR